MIVNFKDASSGNIVDWQWNLGNGATSTQKNPSASYFTVGAYTVSLTVTDNRGRTNTLTRTAYVNVYGKPIINFQAVDSGGCFPVRSQFTDLTTPSAGTSNVSWQWDLGNGVKSTQRNPFTTYRQPGNYPVVLKVTNDKGCYAVLAKSDYIRVISTGIAADFTHSQPVTCRPPFNISFTSTATGPGTISYLWDFGDGTTATGATAVHNYTATGSYAPVLVVTSSAGCKDTITTNSPLVFQNIVTSFRAPDSICVNTPGSFKNTSVPAPAGTTWIFGDGTADNSSDAVKAYAAAGNYTVKLYNTYSYCTDSANKVIKVLPRATAGFTASSFNKCAPPFTVSFTNTSTGAIQYIWDFGDGTTSTQSSPSHTYSTYGNFTVKLILTTASGCTDSLVQNSYIKVQKPVVTVPALPVSGCLPLTISPVASVNAVDAAVSYTWDFGDGTIITGPNPVYTYTVQGEYDIKLITVTSTGCTDSLLIPKAVRAGRRPVIDFTVTPNPVCGTAVVRFTDLTTEKPVSWDWTFGDGGTSGVQNPSYQYTVTGTQNVTLKVTTEAGCTDELTKNAFVTVKPPIALFNITPDCIDRLHFTFTDQSMIDAAVTPLQWLWDFGDGSPASSLQHPDHTYAAAGAYTVTLTVTNGGCSNTITKVASTIQERPDFTASVTEACKTAVIRFTASSANMNNLQSFAWNFFGTGYNPVVGIHQVDAVYNASGLYSVRLITTDIYGCHDTVPKTDYIKIKGPVANFSGTNNTGCKGLTASFNDLSTGDGFSPVVGWKWSFGDATAPLVKTNNSPVQHLYPNTGLYTVQLTVTDASGCVDSLAVPDLVKTSSPGAAFYSTDTLACPGSPVHFTDVSSARNYTTLWDFGNGATAVNTPTPQTTYSDTGHYQVKLFITDEYNCTDSMVKPAGYIRVDRPTPSFTMSDSVSYCTPFEVRFTNTSKYYTSSIWKLNGLFNQQESPTEYYNKVGSYVETIFVTSPGGCIASASKTVTLYDTAGLNITYAPLNGCKPLNVMVTSNAPAPKTFIWDYNDGIVETTSSLNVLHTYRSFGDFRPKALLTDQYNCIIPLTGSNIIKVIGADAYYAVDKKLLCDSGYVHFSDSTTSNDPVVKYDWVYGNGSYTTGVSQDPDRHYSAPGFYNTSLKVVTRAGCTDSFSIDSIKVVSSPLISINSDSVICRNDYIAHFGVFNRADTSAVRWAWQFYNNSSSTLQNPLKLQYTTAGNFTAIAIATNSSGCKDTAIKNIRINPLPVVTLPAVVTTQLGTPVALPAAYSSNVVSYLWQPSLSLSCPDCPEPMANPKFNTVYTVAATDSNGCKSTGQVQVIVICKNSNVFVPNTFSPNGDGVNDIFYIRGRGLNRVRSLRIFNRWGETVFEKLNFNVNDASTGWDGTFKGQKVQPGVYIYQIEIFCDNTDTMKFDGNISLLQ